MKKKKGIKLLFALLAIAGGGVALSSCTGFANSETPIVISDTPEVPDTHDTSNVPNTHDTSNVPDTNNTTNTSNTSNTSNTTNVLDDMEDRIAAATSINQLLSYKINQRANYRVADSYDAKYFTLKDSYPYGKTLQTYGFVDLVDEEENKELVLGLPINTEQYNFLKDYDLLSYDSETPVAEYYNLETLNYIKDVVADEDKTFNYAYIQGDDWDFNYINSNYIENVLEQKFSTELNAYIKDVLKGKDVCTIDFNYITVENSGWFGYSIRFTGTATNQNNKTLSFEVTLGISEQDYNLLMQSFDNSNIDQTANLSDNYQLDFLLKVYDAVNHNTTRTMRYNLGGSGYDFNYDNEETL